MSYAKEIETALDAVRRGGDLCRRIQSGMAGREGHLKEDKSPVTVADYGAQALVCRLVSEAFPADPIVGEEDAGELRLPENVPLLSGILAFLSRDLPGLDGLELCRSIDLGNGAPGGRFWTLDPIDGTKGFLRGDQYAVALALLEEGEVRVGVLACPNLPVDPSDPQCPRGVIFGAVRGEGAFSLPMDGGERRPLAVSPATGFAGARLIEGVEAGHSNHEGQSRLALELGISSPSLRMDSQAKYGAVARGEAEIYLRLPSPRTPGYRENIWDHAAGVLIVEEAGGRVTDMTGRPLDFTRGRKLDANRGVVVSNGPLHDALIEAVREP